MRHLPGAQPLRLLGHRAGEMRDTVTAGLPPPPRAGHQARTLSTIFLPWSRKGDCVQDYIPFTFFRSFLIFICKEFKRMLHLMRKCEIQTVGTVTGSLFHISKPRKACRLLVCCVFSHLPVLASHPLRTSSELSHRLSFPFRAGICCFDSSSVKRLFAH